MEWFRHGMSRFFPVGSDDSGMKLLFLLLFAGVVVGVLHRSAMAATQVCFLCGGSGSFLVGGVRLWLLREGAGGGVAIDFGEYPVSFVYSFRFAVRWEFLFSGSTFSVKTMADRVTGCFLDVIDKGGGGFFLPLPSMVRQRRCAFCGLSRSATWLGGLGSCGSFQGLELRPAVTVGPWPEASASLHIGVCGQGNKQRCLSGMVTT